MKKNSTKNASLIQLRIELNKQKFQALIFGPEQDILNKQSDIYLDRLLLEIELRDGKSKVGDVIIMAPNDYDSIFHKSWFYKMADMLGVSRSVMDTYVKPKYVRAFFIRFVYARLGYRVLRDLRAARKMAKINNAKLYQFLKEDYYLLVQRIAGEINVEMTGKNYDEFIESYSSKYKLPIQSRLF